jgi:hypothetical protein
MTRIDENQEVIAQIRMEVDKYDQMRHPTVQDGDNTDTLEAEAVEMPDTYHHWSLGSPQKLTTSAALEEIRRSDPLYSQFDRKLRAFLKKYIPDELISDLDMI